VLLHASRPATAADVVFASGLPAGQQELWVTHSAIPAASDANAGATLLAYTVLAAGEWPQTVPQQVTVADLWPAPPAGTAYLLWQWGDPACAANGTAAVQCVWPLAGSLAAGDWTQRAAATAAAVAAAAAAEEAATLQPTPLSAVPFALSTAVPQIP
jgi:hypothetical protein